MTPYEKIARFLLARLLDSSKGHLDPRDRAHAETLQQEMVIFELSRVNERNDGIGNDVAPAPAPEAKKK